MHALKSEDLVSSWDVGKVIWSILSILLLTESALRTDMIGALFDLTKLSMLLSLPAHSSMILLSLALSFVSILLPRLLLPP